MFFHEVASWIYIFLTYQKKKKKSTKREKMKVKFLLENEKKTIFYLPKGMFGWGENKEDEK